uniref:arsenate reductase/protein-tyrosine-phosphatase family protein n=1 Tax=Modestobacter altitudinis TaxID=2213158 RepID=UPI00110CA76D
MRLLFVCTGNLCRSPLAERLFRSWVERELGSARGVRVESAGTAAAVGPMDERAAQALRELGGEPDGAVARQLQAGETADIDLVLTMTREQRREVLRRDPRAMRRVFTLAEAATLLPLIDRTGLDLLPLTERTQELAARLDAARARRAGGPADDIRDPIGQSLELHREVAGQIAVELRPLADVLLAPASRPLLP